MQTKPERMRKRPLRMRRNNRIACLLCYLAAFGIPVLWQYAALAWIYPRKLAATAPDFAVHLLHFFPFLTASLSPVSAATADTAAPLYQVLAAREQAWIGFLWLCAAAAWGLTLIIQLIWRFSHRNPILSARRTARAIRDYRFAMLGIWALNAAVAAVIWLSGVRHIPGRTLWDYAVSFGVFALIPLGAALVSRLAASSAISGKHSFFKRI